MYILSVTDYQGGENTLLKFNTFEDAEKEMKSRFVEACDVSGMTDDELEENFCTSEAHDYRSLVYDDYYTDWRIWEF